MSYSHFSSYERFTLYQLRTTENLSMGIIAQRMKRSKSSISRELRRNRINETLYLPDTAQTKMATRRQASKQLFMSVSDSTIDEIKRSVNSLN
jgi:transposase, IS30 family